MTTNRAQKRAARAIAAEKNIRYPEAAALAADAAEPSSAPAQVQNLDPRELQKVRIVFARRYADFLAAGLDSMNALDLISEGLRSIPGRSAEQLIEAIPSVKKEISTGSTAASAWRPHQELLGAHLLQMLALSELAGGGPTPLRDAANTIEAEMRLGIS